MGVRHLEGNVPEVIQSQLRSHRSQGGVRRVAVGTQMGQINVLQGVGCALGNQPCGVDVGQVSLAAANALLERPGPRGFAQEVLIVVGLNDDGLASLELFPDKRRAHTQVGNDPNAGVGGLEAESDGFVRIVRDGEWFDGNVADFERCARLENAGGNLMRLGLPPDSVQRAGIGIDRNTMPFLEDPEAGHMVAVFVRNTDPIDAFGRNAELVEPDGDLTSTKPGVDQKPGVGRGHINRVARASTSQYANFQTHRILLKRRPS